MRNRITAVILGKPQLSNTETIESWINNIKDYRFNDSDCYEDGFDITYYEDDSDIINKLNESIGFDVIVCIIDDKNNKTIGTQFKNLLALNHNIVYRKIIEVYTDTKPEEIGKYILNKFYYNMHNYTDNKQCFTIFTPCFNTPKEDFLRLYNSICNQTYGSWEWFILDDSNTENGVVKYVEELNDFRIRCIKNITNHGNVGYNKRLLAMGAINEYVLEVDHDDELLPTCLEKLNEAFVTYPDCGFCYSNCLEIGYDNIPIYYGEGWGMLQGEAEEVEYKGKRYVVSFTPHINEASIRHIVSAPNHVRCWRSDVYRKIFGHNYNYSIVDDYELIVRTFLNTKMCFILDYLYIQHEEKPTTQRHRNREIQRCTECVRQMYDKDIHNRIIELGFEDSLWNEETQSYDDNLLTKKIDKYFNYILN